MNTTLCFKELRYYLTSTLYVSNENLKAFEIWVWRKMSKVIWSDRKMNEEILGLMREERNTIRTIWERKMNWIGHIVRGDGLMKLVLEARLEGKRMRGRPRMG